jgi:hypothetical protein
MTDYITVNRLYLFTFLGNPMTQDDDTPPTTPAALAGAALERRNADGLAWPEIETTLRAELVGLAPESLEREIERHYRTFILLTTPNPAADRRQQLFDEAYKNSGGLQQQEWFVDVARRTWT